MERLWLLNAAWKAHLSCNYCIDFSFPVSFGVADFPGEERPSTGVWPEYYWIYLRENSTSSPEENRDVQTSKRCLILKNIVYQIFVVIIFLCKSSGTRLILCQVLPSKHGFIKYALVILWREAGGKCGTYPISLPSFFFLKPCAPYLLEEQRNGDEAGKGLGLHPIPSLCSVSCNK